MTFLNPFVLFGLAAAAIPILIHLLNQRKLPTIEFSTLTFLKELQKNKIRKIKIRQWLLLLIRTLLMLVLVLAFSRPALKGSLGFTGTHAKTSLFIILDNSASMELHNEQGKYLAQVKTKANELLSLLQEGDDAVVLRLSELPDQQHAAPTHNLEVLRQTIEATDVSYKHHTIEEALRITSQITQKSQNINKEIYILTDGQRSTFFSDTVSKIEERLFPKNISMFVLSCANSQPENIGIEKIILPSSIVQINKPISLFAVIKNYGTNAVYNFLSGLEIDGKRIMQKSISLEAGQFSTVEFLFTPQRSGFISGKVTLEEDEFPADNTFYFSLFIPDHLQLLLVSPSTKESQYVAAALSVFEQQTSAPVTVTAIPPNQLSERTIENQDVLLLCGVTEVSQSQQQILRSYLTNGGGILFFPSSDTTKTDYRNLFSAINLSTGKLHRAMGGSQSGFTFQRIDFDFPIFKGMFETNQKDLAKNIPSPSVLTSLSFPSANVQSIISLYDGTPFMWEYKIHRGKIIGFSVPATTVWSDFPFTSSFLPFLHQSILYLATETNTANSVEGKIIENIVEISTKSFRGKKNQLLQTVVVRNPELHETILQSVRKYDSSSVFSSIFEYKDASLPGIYIVLHNSDTLYAFAENMNRKESDMRLAAKNEILATAEQLGIAEHAVTFLEPKESIAGRVMQSRFGIELWKYFLLLAAVLALLEMIIGREAKKDAL
ncbi:MAG: BatA domain-containing protein [Bacteroidetes bacterium]|nr:BatA domain-containing protein [Bacteroidota bacterium]